MRIEHDDVFCPICEGSGRCAECASLGTREDYYRVQELAEAAIQKPDGTAARVLDHIEWFSDDLPHRAWWVSKMIEGARYQLRMEV